MNLPRQFLRLLLGRRLARTAGSLTVPGLRSRLRIHRDRWGIPYIEADNDLDAYFGLGFCHGQDRAFQLEVLLRIVRGTVAELIGKDGLRVDRLSRRIGFHYHARQQWPVLDADMQAVLDAYTRGLSAGATLGLPRRPHEFVLLRAQPTPWTPLDSLGLVKLMSFNLASNWDVELTRLRVLLEDGPDALAAVDPAYNPEHPVVSPPDAKAGPAAEHLARDLTALATLLRPGGASNNWAIAASRTRTGRPLLANDPHMNASLPAHWYLAHVRCPQWAAAGASFVGGPNILSGHNGHIAWGVTAGLIDNTDLFREQIGPDGCSVRQGYRWVPCPVREEVIAIKGGPPHVERVLTTPRGPIVGPALAGDYESLSLRAVWLDPLPLGGLLRVHLARNFDQFREILSQWPATSENLAYADANGTIGWQLIGAAPRRRKGLGLLPQPGWEEDAGWEPEHLPFDQLPFLVNPGQGFLATANTPPLPFGTGPFLGVDFIDGYRLLAINRALGSRTDWDVNTTLALQADQSPLTWEEMKDLILDVPEGPGTRLGLDLLRAWDGRLTVTSPAASVFELLVAEMSRRLIQARAPRTAGWVLGEPLSVVSQHNFWCFRRAGHLARLMRTQPDGWFTRPWPAEIADALATVIQRLVQEHGPSPDAWAWGRLRKLVMHHTLGRRSRLLARIFNLGPVPCGGDSDTINQASVMPYAPLEPADNIASMRAVIDVGAWGNSRFALPGGQSGNPLSPHYGDQFPLWQRGEGVPIAWTQDEVRQATVMTLELTPG